MAPFVSRWPPFLPGRRRPNAGGHARRLVELGRRTPPPWNAYQGDPASGLPPVRPLYPTYVPGGPTTGSGWRRLRPSPMRPCSRRQERRGCGDDLGRCDRGAPLSERHGRYSRHPRRYCGTGGQAGESNRSPVTQPAGRRCPWPCLLPPRRPRRRRRPDRLLRLPPQGRRRGHRRRHLDRQRPGLDLRRRGARGEPRLLPVGGYQRRRGGHANVITVGGNTSSTHCRVPPATSRASA